MPTNLLCLSLLLTAAVVPKYTLSYSKGVFDFGTGNANFAVQVDEPAVTKPSSIAFRRDNSFVVWDSRGLTLRSGSQIRSTRLKDVAVSPKLFSPEEIDHTMELVKAGKRSLEATALSGARRLGQRVFLLVRWTDPDGKPWLEALLDVDLIAKTLEPRILGRFDGFTTATGPIDDCLFFYGDNIAAVIRRENDWGLGSYSFADRDTEFISEGEHLVSWNHAGWYIEKTSYDTTVGGRLDLETLSAKAMFEVHGDATWVPGNGRPVALCHTDTGPTLIDGVTGSEQALGSQATARTVGENVLAWSPRSDPVHAVLLDPSRWDILAAWNLRQPSQARSARRRE